MRFRSFSRYQSRFPSQYWEQPLSLEYEVDDDIASAAETKRERNLRCPRYSSAQHTFLQTQSDLRGMQKPENVIILGMTLHHPVTYQKRLHCASYRHDIRRSMYWLVDKSDALIARRLQRQKCHSAV